MTALSSDVCGVLAGQRQWAMMQGDCLQVLPGLPDSSVDLIVADPPYWKVKDRKTCAWDHQWQTRQEYLAWIGQVCQAFQRVLKPNGSLYLFASPQMAAYVEVKVGEWFSILNQIVWAKDAGWARKQCKEEMRAFWPASERILFAEHYGADNIAKGEAGYVAKCDELRGFVFEPLRAYLDGERERAGVSVRQVAEAFQRKTKSRTVTGMAGHWFGRVQWMLPTEDNYRWLRQTLSQLNHNGEYLRRDYEDLRREYEDLRRPFSVTADVPYTDVWDFPTVQSYLGKHPCEKPQALLTHIIRASSREGAVVLDPFMGSGVTGVVCSQMGRRFVGIEVVPVYYAQAMSRLEAEEQNQHGGKLFAWSANDVGGPSL